MEKSDETILRREASYLHHIQSTFLGLKIIYLLLVILSIGDV
jgi:hypothetical protein